jgi:hypothetical protein
MLSNSPAVAAGLGIRGAANVRSPGLFISRLLVSLTTVRDESSLSIVLSVLPVS